MNTLTRTARILVMASMAVLLSACFGPKQPPAPVVVIENPTPIEPAVTIAAPENGTVTELPNSTPDSDPIVPAAPTQTESQPSNEAVLALLNTAQSAQQQGDYRSAQAALQRAQRISPRDQEVYYQLAQVHLDLQDHRLAEQVALKGVSLAQGQAPQLEKFWSLITDIRKAAGDTIGATQAAANALRYSLQ